MRWIAPILLVLSLSCSCRHADDTRPSWIKRGANPEHPDFVFVVGTCKGKLNEDEARKCALQDAREQLGSVYNVRGGLVRDEHGESRLGTVTRGNTTVLVRVYDAWVLMAYPRNRLPP